MAVTLDYEGELLRIALQALEQGEGYAQSASVLVEAGRELKVAGDLAEEQKLLDAWNNLFRDGKLSWGYNLMNPSAPFFHRPS